MDLKKVFATNPKKEVDGVWVDGPEKSRFLIARANNKNAAALMTKLMRPHRTMARNGKLDDAILDDLVAQVTSKHILLDWENVKEGDKEVAYTPEAARAMLKAYPDFADFIGGMAQNVALFQDEEEAAQAKNSHSA